MTGRLPGTVHGILEGEDVSTDSISRLYLYNIFSETGSLKSNGHSTTKLNEDINTFVTADRYACGGPLELSGDGIKIVSVTCTSITFGCIRCSNVDSFSKAGFS